MISNRYKLSPYKYNIKQQQSSIKSLDKDRKYKEQYQYLQYKGSQINKSLRNEKRQIQSMSTLPTKNYIDNISSRTKYIKQDNKDLKNSYTGSSKDNYLFTLNGNKNGNSFAYKINGKDSKLKKVTNINREKQHGHIYKSPIQHLAIRKSKQQKIHYQQQNPQISNQYKHVLSHQHLHSIINNLEQQNSKLRSKVLDSQLKQREYIDKINKLQLLNVKLEQILSKRKTKSKSEDQFLNVMKNAFKDCFGIQSYKDIWAKQKIILRDWMEYKINADKKKKDQIYVLQNIERKNRKLNTSQQNKDQDVQNLKSKFDNQEQNLIQNDEEYIDDPIRIKIQQQKCDKYSGNSSPQNKNLTRIKIQQISPQQNYE